jgi:hypothetical protein
MHRCVLTLCLFAVAAPLFADGPKDNIAEKVRRIPPAGVAIDDSARQELQAGVDELGKKIEALRGSLKGKPQLLELLPDVQIYHKAVDWSLRYDEFQNKKEPAVAQTLLKQGMERAGQLEKGQAPWETETGLVVRGYISKIDGSVQPYGLVVPTSYRAGTPYKHRLDTWFHGRAEYLTELNFLQNRQTSMGEFTPPHAFVLHPYGRYCCANKLAGEVDLFEALDHAKKHYPIDDDRIVVRGFSMGGAACWHFAVHYPGSWAAAAPGAGFSETPDFLKVFQKETLQPTEYEQKLWHMYDCTDYAVNIANCPTVAYSGEKDNQKQAADMMAKALEKEGMELVHIIGPGMGHSYHPESKKEINRRIDSIVDKGRDRIPNVVHFTTWTLRYNKMSWLEIDGMERHWERARVVGGRSESPGVIVLRVENVSALTMRFPPGWSWRGLPSPAGIHIGAPGSEELLSKGLPPLRSDRSWVAHFRKVDGKWKVVASVDDGSLRKRHGLQGPIDDAFLDRFLMVKPTGKPMNEKVGAWVAAEMEHARAQWRQQFRGDALVKNDDAVSDADIASSNLILWGDPASNKVLARIAGKLPIQWNSENVQLGSRTFASANHVPLLIYPNPLNPKRYVVVNSGFTYREYDYLNNARQVPKLPDFAMVDVNTPPSSRYPGKVVEAGFFDEEWKLPK